MSVQDQKDVPGCHYCHFDPATLEPRNEITRVRLAESHLLEFDFRGKTVLDIGCNLGLFSLLAAKRGASRVLGIDVTPEFIVKSQYAKKVFLENAPESSRDRFDIEFQHAGFMDLRDAHRSDVVLCYEVLHWLTAQGVPISVSIEKLRKLTGSDLFLETPWDAQERSLEQYNVSADDYDAEIIFRELLEHFNDVRILRFTDYMRDPRAKRVLIHAANT
jgi:SAM-dependent methyltransferase